ncbi:MAG: hypothetical protein IPN63_06835 [Gammaproteobacteria bacterium]|nr:hypothetical protein [Gammaproteobacteria bacterium]
MTSELVGAKTVDLVPSKPEITVSRHHLRVPGKRQLPIFREVLRSVDLDNHAAGVAKQEQEVHPLPRQASNPAALCQRVWVIMQIDLRSEGWQFIAEILECPVVDTEYVSLAVRCKGCHQTLRK